MLRPVKIYRRKTLKSICFLFVSSDVFPIPFDFASERRKNWRFSDVNCSITLLFIASFHSRYSHSNNNFSSLAHKNSQAPEHLLHKLVKIKTLSQNDSDKLKQSINYKWITWKINEMRNDIIEIIKLLKNRDNRTSWRESSNAAGLQPDNSIRRNAKN